jgi:hypothetical protein
MLPLTLYLHSGILLFVKHERGLELLFAINPFRDGSIAIGAVATSGIQIIRLTNLVRDTVAAGTAKKNNGKSCQRYYSAQKISLKKRLEEGAKVLKQVSALVDRSGKLVEKIEDHDA